MTGRSRSVATVLVAAVAAVVLCTGTAAAYWSATGSGDGSGSTASSRSAADVAAVTATAATTSVLLYPGGTGDVAVTVHNGTSYPIVVGSLTPTAAGASGCTTPALTVAAPSSYQVGGTTVTLPQTVAAGGTTTFTLVAAVSMGASSNDCQAKALTLPVTVGWAG